MICKFIKQEHINHLEYRLEQLSRQREVKVDILRARKDIYYLDKNEKPKKTKGYFWKQNTCNPHRHIPQRRSYCRYK